MKLQYDSKSEGTPLEIRQLVDQIRMVPRSLFDNVVQHNTIELRMDVRSINQGMAVTAKSERDRNVNILVFNETLDTSESYQLLHETYLEGQAI